MFRLTSRKVLLPALLAIAVAPLSFAASATPGQHPGFQEKRQALYERAGIDEETRNALEAAHNEHREAMRDLHRQHREQLAELLTEEQQEALKSAMREAHQERRDGHRQARAERLESLIDGWELDESERQALRDARDAMMADARELREREFDDRDARRAAWQELREKHRNALAEILSEEQIEALDKAMKPRPGHAAVPHGKRGHAHHDRNA